MVRLITKSLRRLLGAQVPTDLPPSVATQRYKAKEYTTTRALSAFVFFRDGKRLGPDWAKP